MGMVNKRCLSHTSYVSECLLQHRESTRTPSSKSATWLGEVSFSLFESDNPTTTRSESTIAVSSKA